MHCWSRFPGISGVTKRVLDGFQNLMAGVLVLCSLYNTQIEV
jgi:hypothetical protein